MWSWSLRRCITVRSAGLPYDALGIEQWLSLAVRSRLEPVKKVAKTIKVHLWGILDVVVLGADNGGAKSINSCIKMVKVRSRGFRNKERFRNAIYFLLGELDLYPAGIKQQGLPTCSGEEPLIRPAYWGFCPTVSNRYDEFRIRRQWQRECNHH